MEDMDFEFDVEDFRPSEEVEEVEEVAAVPEVDYSEGYEAETGESYSADEMQFWRDIRSQAEEMVMSGQATQEEAIELLNGCFRDYIQKKDLQNFIDDEKKHGFTKDDISNEAWELYENSLGKKKLVDCIYETNDFLKGFNSDSKPKTTRASKRHSDPFLDGFLDL